MKKKILLIGNTADLPGVKVDIYNYVSFFKSQFGGQWNDSEIKIKLNPTKTQLKLAIEILKLESLDFLIVVFSGHGGQTRETILELNSSGETIGESELKNIAKRQLNIYDCCRCYPEPLLEKAIESKKIIAFSKGGAVLPTRVKYENRIQQAIPQQVSLYSCSIGEVSNDTYKGGLYSINLIESAGNLNSEYKLVGEAHSEAKTKTWIESITNSDYKIQNPAAILPRCLSNQQLIIGVRP